MGHPDSDKVQKFDAQLKKDLSFLLTKVQSDGGIYGKGLAL